MTHASEKFIVKTPTRSIWAVNFKIAYAFVTGGVAWFMWPDSAYWWGFYPISTLLGLSAFCLLIEALKLIIQIRKFERDQQEFQLQGNPLKKASLAEKDFLTRKGVIHDK